MAASFALKARTRPLGRVLCFWYAVQVLGSPRLLQGGFGLQCQIDRALQGERLPLAPIALERRRVQPLFDFGQLVLVLHA